MLQFPAFRDSPSAVHIGAYNAERPVLVRLYAVNHHLREPSPAPVVATFSSRGRTFTLELRRGMYGYDQGIGAGGTAPPAGVVVHSFNLDGSLRYDGVADLKLFSEMTDWASRRGDFALRIVGMHPEKEYVDVEIRPGGWSSFPIRGVLLLGRFRSQHELNPMSHDDMRNTLIVELTNHSNQKNYQAYDNDTLGGMGAVMVFLRETGIRDDAALRTMSSDDQRNVLIVELDAQTGAGRELQALSNIDLVLVGLGSNRLVRGRVPGLVSSWIRGVLLLGRFRSQHELNQMSHDDMRNTLIVELTNHSNQKNYQAYNDAQLEGAGAVMVAMRLMGIRDDAALRTMSSDDQRNVLIVELDAQTGLGASLQGLSNLELALIPLGVQRATQ